MELSQLIIKKLIFLINKNYNNIEKNKLYAVINLYIEGKNEHLKNYLLSLYQHIENGKMIKTIEMREEILKFK